MPVTETLADLIAHIVNTHHAFLKRELPKLADVFAGLRNELEMHMRKEEMILFPFIERMERAARAGEPPPVPPFGTIANPIRMMEHEHDSAIAALEEMRRLTNGFEGQPGLAALEKDLLEHIHLENDILFPKALALEAPQPSQFTSTM